MITLSPLDLRSEDRADSKVIACEGEAHRPIHPVMVGQGQGIHPKLGGALSQIAYMCGSFSQRIVGVGMEMNELAHRI